MMGRRMSLVREEMGTLNWRCTVYRALVRDVTTRT